MPVDLYNNKDRAATQQLWDASSLWQEGFSGLLLHRDLEESSSTVKGCILDFHTSPTKIFHTTSSASQHGGLELFLAQSIKYHFPAHRICFLLFSEAHCGRFFPPSIFLLFFFLVNTKLQVPGHCSQTLAQSTLKFCLLLLKSFPHTDRLSHFFLTDWRTVLFNLWFVYLKKRRKTKERKKESSNIFWLC